MKEVKTIILNISKYLGQFTKADLRAALEEDGDWQNYEAKVWLASLAELVVEGKIVESTHDRSIDNKYWLKEEEQTMPKSNNILEGLTRYQPVRNVAKVSYLRFVNNTLRGFIRASDLKRYHLHNGSTFFVYYGDSRVVLVFPLSPTGKETHKLSKGKSINAGGAINFSSSFFKCEKQDVCQDLVFSTDKDNVYAEVTF